MSRTGTRSVRQVVETLDELTTRRGDLMLYLQLLAEQGEPVERLASPLPTLGLISGKISAARRQTEAIQDDEGLARRRAELSQLDQLSRRLAIVAAQLQQQ